MLAQIEDSEKSVEIGRSIRTKTWFIFLAAVALRLAVVPLLVGDQLDPARDHWKFGWETGRIAQSLALGHGFSSPLFGSTGPTAWMGPVYPLVLAGIFRIFGIYSTASAYAILSLNCVFAALTYVPLRFVARTAFGDKTGTAAAWAWALFPYSFQFAAGLVWPTALDAFLSTSVLALTIGLERRFRLQRWLLWGATWAILALTEPSLLLGLPVCGLWLMYRLRRRGFPWIFFWRTALAALAFVVIVSPWFVRNQRVFGRFVPFRSNFWLVFYQGNTSDTFDLYPDWANPPHNSAEMAQYASLGEFGYMDLKHQQAIAAVRANSLGFLVATVRRVVYTWTGYWNLSAAYRRIEPFALPNVLMATLLTVLAIRGLIFTLRRARRFAFLFIGLLALLPGAYYVTHPSMEYRHAMDPVLVVLAAAAFVARAASRQIPRAQEETPADVAA